MPSSPSFVVRTNPVCAGSLYLQVLSYFTVWGMVLCTLVCWCIILRNVVGCCGGCGGEVRTTVETLSHLSLVHATTPSPLLTELMLYFKKVKGSGQGHLLPTRMPLQ